MTHRSHTHFAHTFQEDESVRFHIWTPVSNANQVCLALSQLGTQLVNITLSMTEAQLKDLVLELSAALAQEPPYEASTPLA